MPDVFDAQPHQFDDVLIIGDDYFSGVIELWNDTATPEAAFDITGATGVAYLLAERNGPTVATFTFALVVAADGTFQFTLAAATTATLKPGTYPFFLRMTFAAGPTTRTVLEGRFTVRRPG